MSFPQFDRKRLRMKPLREREHDLQMDFMLPLDHAPDFGHPDLGSVARDIRSARDRGAAVILMMGAHVIRAGVSRMIIDLMERGYITHLAMNGAGSIHDFELALIGATTESVARYIREGQFGLWTETGEIHQALAAGLTSGMGYGEAVGAWIEEKKLPYRDISLFAAGFRLRIPVTVHVGVGYDIIHEHPNCDGAVLGEATYRDFLIFAETVRQLENGVFLNFGSAVMGPEVYLKALSMSRNLAHQEGKFIRHFTTAVFDLQDLGEDIHQEAAKAEARYFFRPYKTILVRTVQDGGKSYYIRGPHHGTFPALYRILSDDGRR